MPQVALLVGALLAVSMSAIRAAHAVPSFAHTEVDQTGAVGSQGGPATDVAIEQASFYYAGRIVPWLGAFVQISYDGVGKRLHIDTIDLRQARGGDVFGMGFAYGFAVANRVNIGDFWLGDTAGGPIPYAHLALQQQIGPGTLQIGAYGVTASAAPGDGEPFGPVDGFADIAVDASYRFTFNPGEDGSDVVAAHAMFVHDGGWLKASSAISGANASLRLNTFRADLSYAIGSAVTPAVRYFRVSGAGDFGTRGARSGERTSSGMIAEIAYAPWGKPNSLLSWGNVRLAAQYITYFRASGSPAHTADNSAMVLSIWAAAHF